ncbi:hypothetical protein Q8A67_016854 [Cirrhinus molitorella]|uniref:Uncharacterized protein n=1 Tax=Cirrhinus molitorella TaxID=172907 RepID=A0AA88PIT4_9TELE|nr:hypothetical protein Q8A67_016854 [Cirrhinus molitorella]
MGGSARVYPAPAGAGNPLNPARDRDWGLKLFPTNEEFPDTSIIDTSNALCGPGFLPGPRLTEGRFTYRSGPPGRRGWSVRRGVRSPSVLLNADRLSGEELRRGAPRWVLRPPGRRRWCESLLRGLGRRDGPSPPPAGPPPGPANLSLSGQTSDPRGGGGRPHSLPRDLSSGVTTR